MKKNLFFFLFLIAAFSLKAQDAIIKRTGEEIKAKVRTVSDTEVEYVKFDNLDGPVFKIAKSEVLLIMYSNGTKDIFSNETNTNTSGNNNGNNSSVIIQKGPVPSSIARPAQRYYSYDFFDRKVPVTFLGIDYSYCKLMSQEIVEPKKLFGEINALLIQEKNKYDINGAIRKSVVPYELSIVEKRNNAIVESSLTENIQQKITFNDLQNIVDEYDLATAGITDGICLVIICDNISKPRSDAAYYYVAFDAVSKKVLFSDRLIGRAGGNGQRNYWAKTVHETIMAVKDRKFGQWKMMYRR